MLLVYPLDLSLHCAGILRTFPEPRLLPFPYPRLCARHIAGAEFQNVGESLQAFALPLFSRFASLLAHERISQLQAESLYLSQKTQRAFSCEGEPVAAVDSPPGMHLGREEPVGAVGASLHPPVVSLPGLYSLPRCQLQPV